jgi:heptosyltransferase-3
MTVPLALPDRPRILVITLRRLGDVLLTTPLIRSLRRGFPNARIDMLVFAGTDGILEGNPDIDQVVTVRHGATVGEILALIRRIGLRYDLAISTQTGDRPTLLALVAALQRIGLVAATGGGRWWKCMALNRAVAANPRNHRVVELLRLATCLGIEPHTEVVCPGGSLADRLLPAGPYAVIHANPMFRYRRWTDAGWHTLARALSKRGMTIVATGGADAQERAYLDTLWGGADTPVQRLDGRLEWPELAGLLRGAALYVGADTSVTHLAAASGCPTVALFGPTDPRLWGPWPAGGLTEAWSPAGSIQCRGNVWLVQHALPCTPCQKEGCERHLDSYARCLDDLSVREVLVAVDQALAGAPADVSPRYAGRRA